MTQIAILILAAGASTRMGGRDKLLEDAGGAPLLSRVLARAQGTGLPCYVTVPGNTHARAELAIAAGATPVPVPDWSQGMAVSIATGVKTLPPGIGAVMILPADMPDLTADDLRALATHHGKNPDRILRATSDDGLPGHPVIFPADLFGELVQLSGDRGARDVVAANRSRLELFALPGRHALCDLDTPEQWALWRKAQK